MAIEKTLNTLGFTKINEMRELSITIKGNWLLTDIDGHTELVFQDIETRSEGRGKPAPLTPCTINGNGKAHIKGISSIVFTSDIDGERYLGVNARFGMNTDEIKAKLNAISDSIKQGNKLSSDDIAFLASN